MAGRAWRLNDDNTVTVMEVDAVANAELYAKPNTFVESILQEGMYFDAYKKSDDRGTYVDFHGLPKILQMHILIGG